VGQDNSLACCH